MRALREEKAKRERYFGCNLFASSAFDLLLTLYAADIEGEDILISHVGEESGISQTTSLRMVIELEQEGLVARLADPTRGKHFFIVLTDKARSAMIAYLDDSGA